MNPLSAATTEAEWLEEIKDWPELPKKVATAYPAIFCYRDKSERRFHYVIGDYAYNRTLENVSLEVAHGSGDPNAGLKVYVKPEQLVKCGCGKWEFPTQLELARRVQHINKVRKQRGLPPLDKRR